MKHRRTEIVQESSCRWYARCTCGAETPVVSSKKTAIQAHEVHEAWPDAPAPTRSIR